jgi:ATP-binding cassette subfamily B protein
LLQDPPILLLDEATSGIDSQNEKLIQVTLEKLKKDRTTLIIAHRLGTVMNADRIIVIDKGRVIKIGSHSTLLNACPLYAQLAKLQFNLPTLVE